MVARTDPRRDEVIFFCALCFASSDNASWGGEVTETYCTNCGAGHSAVKIPRWAVESIRQQASWVGKRYYPNDEDKEAYEETKALRATIKEFPGRSAEKTVDGKSWWVTQKMPDGKNMSVCVDAPTQEKALERARLSLPYVPKK